MQSLNILIVDDETNIRKTLTVFMESRSHHVKAFSNNRLKHFFWVAQEIFVNAAFFTNSHFPLFLHGWGSVQTASPHPVMDQQKHSRLFRDILHSEFL